MCINKWYTIISLRKLLLKPVSSGIQPFAYCLCQACWKCVTPFWAFLLPARLLLSDVHPVHCCGTWEWAVHVQRYYINLWGFLAANYNGENECWSGRSMFGGKRTNREELCCWVQLCVRQSMKWGRCVYVCSSFKAVAIRLDCRSGNLSGSMPNQNYADFLLCSNPYHNS